MFNFDLNCSGSILAQNDEKLTQTQISLIVFQFKTKRTSEFLYKSDLISYETIFITDDWSRTFVELVPYRSQTVPHQTQTFY